jgi:hypothetical protein
MSQQQQRGRSRWSDPRVRYVVWVSCVDCGDVRVAGERTTLLRDVHSGEVTLAFRCTRCATRDVASVPPDQLDRLVARGFTITDWTPPLELHEPRPIGPPFTLDDLLDAHQLLIATDDVARLVRRRSE